MRPGGVWVPGSGIGPSQFQIHALGSGIKSFTQDAPCVPIGGDLRVAFQKGKGVGLVDVDTKEILGIRCDAQEIEDAVQGTPAVHRVLAVFLHPRLVEVHQIGGVQPVLQFVVHQLEDAPVAVDGLAVEEVTRLGVATAQAVGDVPEDVEDMLVHGHPAFFVSYVFPRDAAAVVAASAVHPAGGEIEALGVVHVRVIGHGARCQVGGESLRPGEFGVVGPVSVGFGACAMGEVDPYVGTADLADHVVAVFVGNGLVEEAVIHSVGLLVIGAGEPDIEAVYLVPAGAIGVPVVVAVLHVYLVDFVVFLGIAIGLHVVE